MDNYVTKERLVSLLANKQVSLLRAGYSGPFDLTVDSLEWPEYCPALGIKLDYFRKGRGKHSPASPSLDRLDPEGGYVATNVRVISNRANRIKNDATTAELRAIADYVDSQLMWSSRLGRQRALNSPEIGSIPMTTANDAVEPASVGNRPITDEAGSVTQCRYHTAVACLPLPISAVS